MEQVEIHLRLSPLHIGTHTNMYLSQNQWLKASVSIRQSACQSFFYRPKAVRGKSLCALIENKVMQRQQIVSSKELNCHLPPWFSLHLKEQNKEYCLIIPQTSCQMTLLSLPS